MIKIQKYVIFFGIFLAIDYQFFIIVKLYVEL